MNTYNKAQFIEKLFQFHKGTIRTLVIDFIAYHRDHFNSIKVRLELAALPGATLVSSISIP